MAIGNFQPRAARATSLKQSIAIGLDEALTALEESFYDLTDEQAWTCPLAGRHHVATLVMHMLENIDIHACQYQTGELALEHEPRFDIWVERDPDLPARKQDAPSVARMRQRLQTLRAAVIAGLENVSEEDLLGPRRAVDTHWWTEHHRTSADAYARVTWHTMAHVRQIWALRGVMGALDEKGWPQQHYH